MKNLGSFNEQSVELFREHFVETTDFSESTEDFVDFARCQRPDGSFYGTGGQCRKGKETGQEGTTKAAKPKMGSPEKISALRSAIAEAKKAGDKKKLKDLNHDLQINERTAKIQAEAKRTNRSVDDVIRERNDKADAKVKAQIAAKYPNMKGVQESAARAKAKLK